MVNRGRTLLGLAAVGLYAFLYAPLLAVAVTSFNAGRLPGEWRGFTLHWYEILPANGTALGALKNTLLLAGASTLIATILGTLLGYGLARRRGPGARWLGRMLHVPVFVPDIVTAAALLLLFMLLRRWTGWPELGLKTMVLAHVTFQIPFVALVVRARMSGLDPALEEAARDLGATAWRTFRHVTLPLIAPGIGAGALLALTLSLDDFVISFFTSGAGSGTLPILIYSSAKRGISPELNALATLVIVASLACAATVSLLQSRRKS